MMTMEISLLMGDVFFFVINTQYRQPAGNFNEFEAYLNTFLAKSKTTDKTCFLVGDLNLNLIDY